MSTKSSHSEAVIRDALARLDAQDVLEWIDYRPETMQKVGDSIRCFCPIHKEAAVRSLTVDINDKTFRCSNAACPGANGGDLISLYALSRSVPYDKAMADLAEEFGFILLEPGSKDEITRLNVEGEEYISQAEKDPAKRAAHLREAERRLRTVVNADPDNAAALRGLWRIARNEKKVFELGQLTQRLIDLTSKDPAAVGECVSIAREYLEMNPGDLGVRSALAELLIQQGAREEAVAELMTYADAAEQVSQFDKALAAYRRIADLNTDLIDVHPMIVHLLSTLGRGKEATEEIRRRATQLASAGQYSEAAATLETVLDLDPENNPTRLQIVQVLVRLLPAQEPLERSLALVDALMDRSQWREAIEGLRAIEEKLPESTAVLERLIQSYKAAGFHSPLGELELRLARLYRKLGMVDSAMLLLDQMVAAKPEEVALIIEIGDIHRTEDDTEAAAAMFTRALEICEQKKDHEAAVQCLDRLTDLFPKETSYRLRRCEKLIASGRRQDALGELDRMAATAKKSGDDHELIPILEGLVQARPGAPEPVIELAEAWTRLEKPEEAAASRLEAARLLEATGDRGKAEVQLRLLLETAPEDREALRALATLHESLGRATQTRETRMRLVDSEVAAGQFASAREILEHMRKSLPEDLDVLDRLTNVYTELGEEDGLVDCSRALVVLYKKKRDYAAAIEQAEQVAQLRPDDADILRELTDLYELKGDRKRLSQTLLKRAEVLRAAGNAAEERGALADVLRRDTRNLDALERLTLVHLELNERSDALARLDEFTAIADVERATALLRETILRMPDDPAVHTRLIATLRRKGGREDISAAILGLIALHERLGQWREAVGLYREVLSLTPDSVPIRLAFVEALQKLGERGQAVKELLELAELQRRSGRADDALTSYDEAIRLDQSEARAYQGQVEIWRERGRIDRAGERLRALAEVARGLGDHKAAAKWLRAIFEFDSGNREVRRALIELLQQHNQTAETVAELRALAELLRKEGDEAGALTAMREASQLSPSDTELRVQLIQALSESERGGEALEEAFSLVDDLTRQKKYTDALGVLDEILSEQPANIRARKTRAEIFLAQGDEKKAIAEFRLMAPYLERMATDGSVPPPPPPTPPRDGLPVLREYDFDTFVVGQNNNFAHATCLALAKAPGTAYNPVFLYADVGLGKTHLLHAIANYWRTHMPAMKLCYTNAEDFTDELIDAIQNNTVPTFRQKYKSVDALLLDDVQFLAGKERSQEEFFHIFNTLFQAKRQIVVASDRPPKDIAHLEKRLKSRFGAGVVVDIQAPDVETRVAILRRESKGKPAVFVPDEVMRLLADRVDSNIRELKGALNQIILQHEIVGAPVSVPMAQKVLDRLIAGQ